MKTIIAALVALTAAAPAMANSQLARELGVEPGKYTLEQLVVLKNASTQTGNEARVNLENAGRTGALISTPVGN